LLGRTQCLKLLVAVTILTCATEADRAEALNKWIQVAIDTKTALGNLYGFCGVMMGLCMPQVSTRMKPVFNHPIVSCVLFVCVYAYILLIFIFDEKDNMLTVFNSKWICILKNL
jgi:uncharacterized protein YacL